MQKRVQGSNDSPEVVAAHIGFRDDWTPEPRDLPPKEVPDWKPGRACGLPKWMWISKGDIPEATLRLR
eukprot:14200453-Alexandrium_andersonii.AAC.1